MQDPDKLLCIFKIMKIIEYRKKDSGIVRRDLYWDGNTEKAIYKDFIVFLYFIRNLICN